MGRTAKLPAEEPVERGFVRYREAETITGLSRWTLARHVKAGHLRAFQVGAAVCFKVQDLIEFVEAHEVVRGPTLDQAGPTRRHSSWQGDL